MNAVSVFAPGTIANVAVGFDVLGFAFHGVGDRATVSKRSDVPKGTVTLELAPRGGIRVPEDPDRNTAAGSVRALLRHLDLDCGFHVYLEKGIPLGSGLGGSAASAVAAVVAANLLGDRPLPPESLIPFALAGEAIASGAAHLDNVVPCLLGGFTAAIPGDPPQAVPVPVPGEWRCVVAHPRLTVETRAARAALDERIDTGAFARQSAHLAGFLAGCYEQDPVTVRANFRDVIIGPQRAGLIPGFHRAREAALDAGAMGLAIAGSGPSVFAWTESEPIAGAVQTAVSQAFARDSLPVTTWISPIGTSGAHRVP